MQEYYSWTGEKSSKNITIMKCHLCLRFSLLLIICKRQENREITVRLDRDMKVCVCVSAMFMDCFPDSWCGQVDLKETQLVFFKGCEM